MEEKRSLFQELNIVQRLRKFMLDVHTCENKNVEIIL